MAKYFILGAFDRKTKQIRMSLLTFEEACNSSLTVKLLKEWLNEDTFLVCQKAIPKGVLEGVKTVKADPSVRDDRSTLPHCLNIRHYLRRTLSSMFRHYVPQNQQAKEYINYFLAERQWREKLSKYGVEGAFWNILDLIKEQNPPIDEAATIGIPAHKKAAPTPPKERKNACQERWGDLFTERCKALLDFSTSENRPSWKEADQGKTQTYEKVRGLHTSKTKDSVSQSEKEDVFSVSSSSMDSFNNLENVNLISVENPRKPYLLSLLREIPEIKGSSHPLSFEAILSVKIHHLKRPKDILNYRRSAVELGTALRKEGFHSHPVKWLVKKNFINHMSKCYVCDSTALLRDNDKFPDGCSWSCQNKECKFENIFKRPKFFASYPHQSMSHLLALVFHWIAQTKIDNILTDTSIKRQKIAHMWKVFQSKCNQTLVRENMKFGGPSSPVELAVVEHGNKYVLGIMDTISDLTAMKCFQRNQLTEEEMFSFLKLWLRPGTAVIVNAHPDFPLPRHYHLIVADPNPSMRNAIKITRYLKNHMKNNFGKFNPVSISPLMVQLFLDELMWRERFDLHPITSFTKLMQELFIDELTLVDDLKETDHGDAAEEVSTCPVKLKELQIVLKRIPQTVLKYYNCLDLDPPPSSEGKASSQKQATASKLETVVEKQKGEENEAFIDVENDVESSNSSQDTNFPNLETTSFSDVQLTHTVFSEEVIATPSDPVFNREPPLYHNENSDEDYVADDSDSDEEEEDGGNSSADEFNSLKTFRNFKWKNVRRRASSKKFQPITYYKNSTKSPNLSESLENFVFVSDSSRNSNSTQSVQPLVINVCRKNKEPKFFIKSDSSATVSAAENSRDYDGYASESRPGSVASFTEASASLDSGPSVCMKNFLSNQPTDNKSSSNIEPAAEPQISSEAKPQTSDKEKKPNSVLKRRAEDVQCMECGDTISETLEHFMKQFKCGDCKGNVYTSCCSNAFMEHRGSLLFGKRMPKKLKRQFGLHKNVVLNQPWYCKCGFNSSHGNKLASHLLNCPKSIDCVSTQK